MEKVVINWSKKDHDWQVKYPDRNGKKIGGAFFNMFRLWEEWVCKDWQGNKIEGFSTFRKYLEDAGYDPDSLRITANKK